jgi:hypothetical protein
MRSMIAVVSSVALVVAQIPPTPAFAQSAVSPQQVLQSARLNPAQAGAYNPAIAEAFLAFPKGGELLSKRIADLIVKDPKVALDLVKYVRETPGLNSAQKLAAERGLAAALDRLGIKAADMPVKAPAPVAEENWDWLLAALLLGGLIGCIASFCRHEHVSGN